MQLAVACLYAVAATVLLVFTPFPAMPEPAINLGQAEVESLLGPLAPMAIALAALVAYDFLDYWVHRAQHRFAFLWRFHAVHHSVEDLDSLNSYTHPVDLLGASAALIVVSLWIGFTFETMLWFLAFQTIHDRLVHTRAPVNFGAARRPAGRQSHPLSPPHPDGGAVGQEFRGHLHDLRPPVRNL